MGVREERPTPGQRVDERCLRLRMAAQAAEAKAFEDKRAAEAAPGLLSQWWFWGAVGVVVIGAAVGTTLALSKTETPEHSNGEIVLIF